MWGKESDRTKFFGFPGFRKLIEANSERGESNNSVNPGQLSLMLSLGKWPIMAKNLQLVIFL